MQDGRAYWQNVTKLFSFTDYKYLKYNRKETMSQGLLELTDHKEILLLEGQLGKAESGGEEGRRTSIYSPGGRAPKAIYLILIYFYLNPSGDFSSVNKCLLLYTNFLLNTFNCHKVTENHT